jgi:hypothetical protein
MTLYHSNVPTLHITNGSHAGDKLATFVDGPVRITADVLHEGPAPRVEGDAWYEVRAKYLCADGGCRADEVRADLARSDRTIADAVARGDNLVLWFEHDLFDQLLLIRTLDLLARGDLQRAGLDHASLICIDRFRGVERFIGLGQLEPEQLATLYPSRTPVTADQAALAAAAWDAFRSPDPRALIEVAVRATAGGAAAALPFLGDALWRFFAEYPSVETGLTHTESLALAALAGHSMTFAELFAATQRREARPFMGDLTFFRIIGALAAAHVPLVAIAGPSGPADLRERRVEILDDGREVLDGRRDRVALNGIDMWRGGVHLNGANRSSWRWDARRKTLVS